MHPKSSPDQNILLVMQGLLAVKARAGDLPASAGCMPRNLKRPATPARSLLIHADAQSSEAPVNAGEGRAMP